MDIKEQAIRMEFPDLYEMIAATLESIHIHSYDVEINIKEGQTGYEIIIYFGDGYVNHKSEQFTRREIHALDASISDFIRETGEKIKEVMVSDYFKMMKP